MSDFLQALNEVKPLFPQRPPVVLDISVENPRGRRAHISAEKFLGYLKYPSVSMETTVAEDQFETDPSLNLFHCWLTIVSDFRFVDEATKKDRYISSVKIGQFVAFPRPPKDQQELSKFGHVAAVILMKSAMDLQRNLMSVSGYPANLDSINDELLYADLENFHSQSRTEERALSQLVFRRVSSV